MMSIRQFRTSPIVLAFGLMLSTVATVGLFSYSSHFKKLDATQEMLFAPEICDNGIDDDSDGLVDCLDSDCSKITIGAVTVSSVINHPLKDLATITFNVSWTTPPANDTIMVSAYGKTRYIATGSAAGSQAMSFNVAASGTQNLITTSWRKATSLCPNSKPYTAPAAFSSERIKADILYLCGNDKPWDGDAWDHGFINYLNEINGSSFVMPVLTKADATGYGLYDPMNPSTPLTVTFSDYELIVVSATTEGHIAPALVNYLKDTPIDVMNSNYQIINELGLSTGSEAYQFQSNAYINNTTAKAIYDFEVINPYYGKVFTMANVSAGGDGYLWANANNQTTNINSFLFFYDNTDPLSGVAATHGDRVYLGYHMNGIYVGAETGYVLPAPTSTYLDPIRHFTIDGKYYFDLALTMAGADFLTAELCGNSIDDDGDGLTDCNDNDCSPTITYAIADCQAANADINLTVASPNLPVSYRWSDLVAEAIWTGNNTTNDASGNGRNIGVGSVGTITYDAVNKIEGSHAFNFDGATFLRYGVDAGFLETAYTARTYSMWVKPANLTGTKILFEQGGSSAGMAAKLTNNLLAAAYRTTSTTLYTTGNLTFPNDAAWHHVAVVFNNGVLTCYLDGVASTNATSASTTIPANANNDAIGGRNSSDVFASGAANYYSGKMDDIRLFYSALTAQNIADVARNDGDRLNLAAGTYTVTVTSSSGCTATRDVTMTIPCAEICNNGVDDDADGLIDCADTGCTTPVANAGANQTICKTLSATLSASATGGSGFTYAWSNGLGSGATKTVTPSATTTYTVTVTNATGCVAIDQVTVTVNTCPVENCSNGIDDDADGLVDNADTDCRCGLINNPGFENGLTGWSTNGSGATIVADPNTGLSAARITADNSGVSQQFPVVAGQVYKSSVFVKASGTFTWASVGIQWYNASNVLLDEVVFSNTYFGSSYNRLDLVDEVPPGATTGRLFAWRSSGSVGSSVTVDNFCSELVTGASVGQCGEIFNGGFENDLLGWQGLPSNFTISNSARTGTKAIRLNTNNAVLYQDVVPVTPGSNYELTLYAKRLGNTGSGYAALDWYNSSSANVGSKTINIDSFIAGYKPFKISSIAPATATKLRVSFNKTSGSDIIIDDICLDLLNAASVCNCNKNIFVNGGFETYTPLVTFPQTLQGKPALKINGADNSKVVNWNGGGTPPDDFWYYVNDETNTVNNPEGKYFAWLAPSFCQYSNVSLTTMQLVDGAEYEICLYAAPWNIALDASGFPTGAAVTQGKANLKLELGDLENVYSHVHANWELEASTSWNTLNWQKLSYRFVYNANIQMHGLTMTNSSAQGLAIDGISLSRVDCSTSACGMLSNPGFEQNLYNWDANGANAGTSATAQSGVLAGRAGQNSGLSNTIPIDPAKDYMLEFWAKRTVGSNSTFLSYSLRDKDWNVIGTNSYTELPGTTWTFYQIPIKDIPNNAMLVYFEFGAGSGVSDELLIDNVCLSERVFENCANGIDDDADGLVDCNDPDCSNITNGEFDMSTLGWQVFVQSGNSATLTQDATSQLSGVNSARVNITTALGTDWHVQLAQPNKALVSGKTYSISFRAKASSNRNISTNFQQNGTPYTNYWSQTTALTTTAQTFNYQFTPTASNATTNLLFNVGIATGTVWIDNVVFREACPVENCTNGIDDDSDGLVDAADPDCSAGCSAVHTPENNGSLELGTMANQTGYNGGTGTLTTFLGSTAVSWVTNGVSAENDYPMTGWSMDDGYYINASSNGGKGSIDKNRLVYILAPSGSYNTCVGGNGLPIGNFTLGDTLQFSLNVASFDHTAVNSATTTTNFIAEFASVWPATNPVTFVSKPAGSIEVTPGTHLEGLKIPLPASTNVKDINGAAFTGAVGQVLDWRTLNWRTISFTVRMNYLPSGINSIFFSQEIGSKGIVMDNISIRDITTPDAGRDTTLNNCAISFDLNDATAGTAWKKISEPAGNSNAAAINVSTGLVTNMNAQGDYVFSLYKTATPTCADTVRITKVCLPEICSNGIDDDGDGLIDCADNDCYLAANSGGTDSDGDSIGNSCDMDDDNDGISDANECQTLISLDFLDGACRLNGTIITSNTALSKNDVLTFSNLATLGNGTVVDGKITINHIGRGLNYDPGFAHFELTPYIPTSDDYLMFTLELFDASSLNIIPFRGQMVFRDIDSQENFDFTELLGIKQNHAVSLGSNLQLRSYQNGGGPANHKVYGVNPATAGVVTNWTDEVNASASDINYWVTANYETVTQLEVSYGVTGTSGDGSNARDLYISSSFQILDVCDLDGDGIANHLDLDTDGDGCPDAVEGSANFAPAGLVASGMAGGNSGGSYTGSSSVPVIDNLGNTVATVPASGALGIPTIAGNGQGVGDSQNGAIQSSDCSATENCTNGIDDDGDGLVDSADPDCCTTVGNAIAVVRQTGVTNATNAIGVPNGSAAELFEANDSLVLDLGTTIPVGSKYKLVWRRKASYANTVTADIIIEEGQTASAFTQNPTMASTTERTAYIQTIITANVPTRYLRLRIQTNTDDDAEIDAVQILNCGSENCTNGLDDDGDGLVDCADPDCIDQNLSFGACTNVLNPGFESNLTSWTQAGTVSVSSTIYRTGTKSLNITGASSGVDQSFNITAGQVYKLEGWGRKDGANWAGLGIDWLNSSGNIIHTVSAELEQGTTWRKHAVVEIAPVGAVQANVWAYADGGMNAYFDDFCFSTNGQTTLGRGTGSNIFLNGDFEQKPDTLTYPINLAGSTARHITSSQTNLIPGWEAAIPATRYAFFVNDQTNQVNNPSGNHFIWLADNNQCWATLGNMTSASLQDGKTYTISLYAAPWEATLGASFLPNGGAAVQGAGKISLEFAYDLITNPGVSVAEWNLPVSSSWNSMNWKLLTYTFTYDASHPLKKIYLTNVSAKGIAIDDMQIRENVSCAENCTNGIDDDGDGLVDCDDPDCNLITNGEFNSGITGWSVNLQPGASATHSVVNTSQLSGVNSAFVDITAATGTNWHIQLFQANKSIVAGQSYTVSFQAKAAANRNANVFLQRSTAPYPIYWQQNFALTTTAQSYSYSFTADSTITNNAGLFFNLGENIADVWIDNVKFTRNCAATEICGNGIDDDGDGAIDNNDPNCFACSNGVLSNPDFNSNFTDWYNWDNSSIVQETNGNKYVHIETGGGGVSRDYPVTPGSTYSLNFKARVQATTDWAWGGFAFLDAGYNLIGYHQNSRLTATNFMQYHMAAVAPPGAAFIRVAAWKDYGTGTAGFDGFCLSLSTENCSNGLDDDADGLIDCNDPSCPCSQTVAVGNLVYIDADNDKVFDAGEGVNGVQVKLFLGNDNPLIATPVATTTTANGGKYLFDNLAVGEYIVFIPPSEFATGKPLFNRVSVDGYDGDYGNDDENSENGLDNPTPAVNGIRSSKIGLFFDSEPITTGSELGHDKTSDDAIDPSDDDNTDLTIDFGFVTPAPCTMTISQATATPCYKNGSGNYVSDIEVTVYWSGFIDGDTIRVSMNGVTDQFAPYNEYGGIIEKGVQHFFLRGVPAAGGTGTVNAQFVVRGGCTATKSVALPNCTCPTGQLAGTAWQDFNNNGVQEAHETAGIAGVTVMAFDCTGALVGTTTTNAQGQFTFTGLTDGDKYRIEFSTVLAPYFPSEMGTSNGSNVQFVTSPSCVITFGVNNPDFYCQENPLVGVPCYVNGLASAPGVAAHDAFVLFPYEATAIYNPGTAQIERSVNPTHASTIGEIGSTWGVAYQRSSKTLFTSAVIKRHAGLGPLGTGGIYKINAANPAVPTTANWVDVKTLGVDTGTDPRDGTLGNTLPTATTSPSFDIKAYDAVGKKGIGDIDFDEARNTLWFVNLHERTLVGINNVNPNSAPTAANVVEHPISLPAGYSCGVNGELRPWGLKVHEGRVYIGIICTNQGPTWWDATGLRAYVVSFNPDSPAAGFRYETDIDMSYDKVQYGTFKYNNWVPSVAHIDDGVGYTTPILSDIEFDLDGSMILGFADRLGLQVGYYNYAPDETLTDQRLFAVAQSGDLLRLCKIGNNYVLPGSNPACPLLGVVHGDGINGGEHYWADWGPHINQQLSPDNGFNETAMGGIAFNRSAGEVISTQTDPTVFYSGGTMTYNNVTGGERNAYTLYVGVDDGGQGKTTGLGDLELLCNIQPIEVGNYVWLDEDDDGIQDACEPPLDSVKVSLYKSNGLLIGQTTTNAFGNYVFNETNVDTLGFLNDNIWTGLSANANYVVVVGNVNNNGVVFANGKLKVNGIETVLTFPNLGQGANPDMNDSDGTILGGLFAAANGFPGLAIKTPAKGSLHNQDFGFRPLCENFSVFAGTDVTICNGTTTTLTATGYGGLAPYSFAWSNGLGSGASKSVTPVVTTTYTVTITDADGCIRTDQVVVNITVCSEVCGDGIDNDSDGLVDCGDPDCAAVGQPQLANDVYETCPGVVFVEQPIFNDVNLQNPVFSIYANATKGNVTINFQGVFTYTPFVSVCGVDSFKYQVCNALTGCCDQATVVLQIGDNDPPVLQNMPADITINCGEAVPAAPLVFGLDDCPGISVSFDEVNNQVNAGSCQNYTIVRTWRATDKCGNFAVGTQTITVQDVSAPEVFRVYTLLNGKKMIGGVRTNASTTWQHIKFPISFSQTPLVFPQVVSVNGSEAVMVRIRNVDSEGFEMKMQEQEASDGIHATEQVAWLAMEAGAISGTENLQAGLLANVGSGVKTLTYSTAFATPPVLIAATQTNVEADPMQVRFSSMTAVSAQIFLQEEQSLDAETSHGNEQVAYLACKAGDIVDENGDDAAVAATVALNHIWKTVNFGKKITKPVVVFGGQPTGDDPATIRVRNVTATSFEARIEEWPYSNGTMNTKTVSYFVVEGSIPAEVVNPCETSPSPILPGLNLFAVDNCDNQVAINYSESSTLTPNGLLKTQIWISADDCGNASMLQRTDTCNLAAVRLRANLGGPLIGGIGSQLTQMRDNLRVKEILPASSPYNETINENGQVQVGNQSAGNVPTVLPAMLQETGNNAIVDWVMLELRDPVSPDSVVYLTPGVLQRDGDVVTPSGGYVFGLEGMPEGYYFVRLKHRNHIGMMSNEPIYLKIADPPMVDFTSPDMALYSGDGGGKVVNGVRMMWPGDLNTDNKVIYQGPSNDVFRLFSVVMTDPLNSQTLANFIKEGYNAVDLNMDGSAIYQGPNNDRSMMLLNTILAHPNNTFLLANFLAAELLP